MKPRVCEDVRAALGGADFCEETERGARVVTQCLYPSFDPVSVFVARFGEGYLVTDGGGAAATAWAHGRDDLHRLLRKEAQRFCVTAVGETIQAEAKSIEWLHSAILAVANSSASAARIAVDRAVQAAEKVLSERILEALSRVVHQSKIAADFEYRGASGKQWRADFAVMDDGHRIIVNGVTPHHASISAKYVAFADIEDADKAIDRFAVFERPLASADRTLLAQVAALVPVRSLSAGTQRILVH